MAQIHRIALVGNFPPRLCGIATFTADIHRALKTAFPDCAIDVYAMNDPGTEHVYTADVAYGIGQNHLSDYQAAAHQINESGADVVLVQHEYGIFGGPAGAHLLRLLDRVDAPVVVTLHTVLEKPDADQRAVIEALARRSAKLVVMAEKGREILERVHGISSSRIVVIPHGVPDRPFVESAAIKPQFGFEGRHVLLTFGLLSPNKGIETMIRAIPAIAALDPTVLYVVLGATHPHLRAHEGEAYRERLMALADELGVAGNIRFVDGFLQQDVLLDYLAASDVYVTPYLNEAQITSGTLSYAVGLGKPVVSTPYWHAAELLSDGVGILVPFADSAAFADAITDLLRHPDQLGAIRDKAWALGREMTWAKVAEGYMAVCRAAAGQRPIRLAREALNGRTLIAPQLTGVERMTDGCGMLQHSIFTVADRDHGYCVDDNCRALLLMHRLGDADPERSDRLALIYASFVQHAWNGAIGRFRNFMAFDRAWLEQEGSEDSFGRSLWSIGATASEARSPELRRWALHLFDQVAPHVHGLGSPRTWAFAILGAAAVLDGHPGHGYARTLIAEFGARLQQRLAHSRRDGWEWFESVLGYDNARLPEAMIIAGHRMGNRQMLADGLTTLAWLDRQQTNNAGQFRAIGTDSFGREYATPLPFDQQPLEAWATIDAMVTAHEVTGDDTWLEPAWRAYRWYLGANDIGVPVASAADGGCFDGLMSDRVNLNQGAESVLAFQFACCAMAQLARRGDRTGGNTIEAAAS